MEGPERRTGEDRRSGEDRRKLDNRYSDRRMGGDRRLSFDQNLDMFKRQGEIHIDEFAASLKKKTGIPDLEFNQIVWEAKGKLQTVWAKYKRQLEGAEKERDPEKEKKIWNVARDDFEHSTKSIKNEMQRAFELLETI